MSSDEDNQRSGKWSDDDQNGGEWSDDDQNDPSGQCLNLKEILRKITSQAFQKYGFINGANIGIIYNENFRNGGPRLRDFLKEQGYDSLVKFYENHPDMGVCRYEDTGQKNITVYPPNAKLQQGYMKKKMQFRKPHGLKPANTVDVQLIRMEQKLECLQSDVNRLEIGAEKQAATIEKQAATIEKQAATIEKQAATINTLEMFIKQMHANFELKYMTSQTARAGMYSKADFTSEMMYQPNIPPQYRQPVQHFQQHPKKPYETNQHPNMHGQQKGLVPRTDVEFHEAFSKWTNQ